MVTDVSQLPDIDSSWVRTYNVDRDGISESFSVLEAGPIHPRGTIVCVHGNPTWSFMWRNFVRELSTQWRVIAVDQLGMGFSSRSKKLRTLATRIEDLDALLVAAKVEGPVTLMAHDWGGPVAIGWATQHPERVEKLVLFNTGTQIPISGIPGLIQVSNTPVLRNAICTWTKAFIAGAVVTTGGIPRNIRKAYYTPYASSSQRRAIAQFVADIPTHDNHVTAPVLRELATRAQSLQVPTLLMWGVRDFVFHTGVLADVQSTFPHAQTITLDTGHLSPEHIDAPRLVREWLSASGAPTTGGQPLGSADLNDALRRRAKETPDAVAVFDAKEKHTTTWRELEALVVHCRGHLVGSGVGVGDRVAILAPFTARTIAFIYACWAQGVVPVVADPGLGIANMRRALRESRPKFVVTIRATRIVARVLHLAHRAKRLDLTAMTQPCQQSPSDWTNIGETEIAAVLYTSGATGPAKGVVYTHGQLRSLADAIQQQFSINDGDGIAAAYIPFALYGPAWGVAVGLPKINVVAPGKLSTKHLRAALDGVNGTILFAAPAPLRNVIKDGAQFLDVRCVMSAGAPVSDVLLRDVAQSFPHAQLFSPYGMTEMLIITDGVRASSTSGGGVPVGHPLPGVEVVVFPFGCVATDDLAPVPTGATGEIFVTGPWLSVGYDQHWARNKDARVRYAGREWHRTGDVGHVQDGLFVEGRIAHVVNVAGTQVTPVPIEQSIEEILPGVTAAAVGVHVNHQQGLVVVLCDGSTTGVADLATQNAVQGVAPQVTAVVYKKTLPVDRRHNSKIDRTALGVWASEQLSK
jgi:acyl-CoA synthetase (AMP-forming)/AMP-acid ligase II/pimeloyl-ACP methyl ester carboxylesterase